MEFRGRSWVSVLIVRGQGESQSAAREKHIGVAVGCPVSEHLVHCASTETKGANYNGIDTGSGLSRNRVSLLHFTIEYDVEVRIQRRAGVSTPALLAEVNSPFRTRADVVWHPPVRYQYWCQRLTPSE